MRVQYIFSGRGSVQQAHGKAWNPSITISSVIPKRKSACKMRQMPPHISDVVVFPRKHDTHPRVNRVVKGITKVILFPLFLTLHLGITLVYQGPQWLWWICVVYQLFLDFLPRIHNTKSHICPHRCGFYPPWRAVRTEHLFDFLFHTFLIHHRDNCPDTSVQSYYGFRNSKNAAGLPSRGH